MHIILKLIISLILHSKGNNNLHGVIPKEIAILTDLKVLSLFDNMLIGNVPDELTALDNLGKCSFTFSLYQQKNLLCVFDGILDLNHILTIPLSSQRRENIPT